MLMLGGWCRERRKTAKRKQKEARRAKERRKWTNPGRRGRKRTGRGKKLSLWGGYIFQMKFGKVIMQDKHLYFF